MEDVKELAPEQSDVLAEEEGSEEEEDCDLIPSLEGPSETNTEEVGGAEPATGLRRRTRPEWPRCRTEQAWQIIMNIYYMTSYETSPLSNCKQTTLGSVFLFETR